MCHFLFVNLLILKQCIELKIFMKEIIKVSVWRYFYLSSSNNSDCSTSYF